MTGIYTGVIISTIVPMNSVLCLPYFYLNSICQTVSHGLPLFREILIDIFLQSGSVVRKVWEMIHTIATCECRNVVSMFKALRRSAVKDLINSVYPGFPRLFFF